MCVCVYVLRRLWGESAVAYFKAGEAEETHERPQSRYQLIFEAETLAY
jgi:hypothetical protein